MIRIFSGLALSLVAGAVQADVWIWDPSASIDQRFDDNFTIDPDNSTPISATRLVGSLGVSRESQIASITGFVRADALLTLGDDGASSVDNELNSNQIIYFDVSRERARSKYGINLNFKRDTPNRDISADITDPSITAADTGANITQSQNVARSRIIINPTFTYNLSRRSTIETQLSFTSVSHDSPSVADSLRTQFELGNPGAEVPDDLSIDDIGVFTVLDELDDFNEQSFSLDYNYKLSRISSYSLFFSHSRFDTDTEADPSVIFPFEEKIPDPGERQILRNPKRSATSNTTTVRVGWNTAWTQTLNIGAQVGVFQTRFDDSDLFRESDQTSLSEEDRQARLDSVEGTERGFVGAFTADLNRGISRYSGRLAVDVLPSNIGSQVESLEVTGDYFRQINPLLDFSFRMRAFEPDAINAANDDEFARRFFSMEPKLIWRFTRTWTAAASYRYRRQKNQINPRSGDSNALLFSIKYSPPLEIRDLKAGG